MNSGRKNVKNSGFTLIELLVVIAIIGILSAVIMAGLNVARGQARNSYITQTIGQYLNAIELYQSGAGYYPTPIDVGDITTKTYCLGDYPSPNTCGDSWWTSSENSGLHDAMSIHIPGVPPVTTSDITIESGWDWRGATYQCLSLDGSSKCKNIKIVWYLEGVANCGYSATADSYGGTTVTQCTLYWPK